MIFTLDGRDNVFLEVMKARLKLTYEDLYNEINGGFEILQKDLVGVGVAYNDLKNALIPNSTKKEIALVFDSRRIGNYYGPPIFEQLIPLFDLRSNCSVLCGDILGDDRMQYFLKHQFLSRLVRARDFVFGHSDFYFIVYINNLSIAQIDAFHTGLQHFDGYVGFFDTTYSSPLKTYLSMVLVKHFLKCGKTILSPDEETKKGYDLLGYPFDRSGYRCNTINEMWYRLFLSFKIEREAFVSTENDHLFALSTITPDVMEISDFDLLIEDSKLEYLKSAKKDNMERSGMLSLTAIELQDYIRSRLHQNYLYNLDYNSEHGVLKFNINIESSRIDSERQAKMLVSLEYKPADKTLRLITMF